MIQFELNGQMVGYAGEEKLSLLDFLRLEAGITSVKDGCSGQGACGACLVELNGRPALSCVTTMKKVAGGSGHHPGGACPTICAAPWAGPSSRRAPCNAVSARRAS